MESQNLANATLIIGSAAGVYIPSTFAESYPALLTDEQKADLSDHHNEHYWETWETVLNTVSLHIEGKKCFLFHDEDLWAIPNQD